MSKPKLLVLELWRVGDLAMASPFLRQATRRYEVTLVAQPMACEFQRRFWPEVRVIPFEAPWTVFLGKYRLHKWPWAELGCLMRNLRRQEFDCSVSARWDPRDHFVLWLSGAQERIGFPRVGSGFFLSRRLSRPPPHVHRYDLWKRVGAELGLELPSRQEMPMPALRSGGRIVVHTGAGAPVRVWPLERWRDLIIRLRERGAEITLLSDPIQRDTWLAWGERHVRTPSSIAELIDILESAVLFIGHDSGPGHLAALMGVPTFTLFGPQLAESFLPIHPRAQWIDGRSCPHKPCFDYCRYPIPHCLRDVSVEEVLGRVKECLKDWGLPGS